MIRKSAARHAAPRVFYPPLIAGESTGEGRGSYVYRNRHGQWVPLRAINDFGIARIFSKFERNTAWWYVVRDEGIRRHIIDADGNLVPNLGRLVAARREAEEAAEEESRSSRAPARRRTRRIAVVDPDFPHEE